MLFTAECSVDVKLAENWRIKNAADDFPRVFLFAVSGVLPGRIFFDVRAWIGAKRCLHYGKSVLDVVMSFFKEQL